MRCFPTDPTIVKADFNYVELKVGASAELWKDGTLGVTVFFSPDYQYETGNVWTVEAAFTQNLRKFMFIGREWSPSVSALIGYQAATGNDADKARYLGNVTGDDDNYVYWNAGLTLGFLEKWSVDLRYWDTNIDRAETAKALCLPATSASWQRSNLPTEAQPPTVPTGPFWGPLLFGAVPRPIEGTREPAFGQGLARAGAGGSAARQQATSLPAPRKGPLAPSDPKSPPQV